MTITAASDRDLRIARLFNVLWHGERIACAIATRQARVCREPRARRFFALQATQEALHATVFHAAATLLAPRGRTLQTPAIAVLGDYRRRLDDDWRLRLISRLHNWRCRLSRVFYGDQAMFVRSARFHALGGFPEQPILEDVALSEKLLAIAQPKLLDEYVVTDARKFIKMGIWRSLGRVFVIMLCYRLRLRIPMREFFTPVR